MRVDSIIETSLSGLIKALVLTSLIKQSNAENAIKVEEEILLKKNTFEEKKSDKVYATFEVAFAGLCGVLVMDLVRKNFPPVNTGTVLMLHSRGGNEA